MKTLTQIRIDHLPQQGISVPKLRGLFFDRCLCFPGFFCMLSVPFWQTCKGSGLIELRWNKKERSLSKKYNQIWGREPNENVISWNIEMFGEYCECEFGIEGFVDEKWDGTKNYRDYQWSGMEKYYASFGKRIWTILLHVRGILKQAKIKRMTKISKDEAERFNQFINSIN